MTQSGKRSDKHRRGLILINTGNGKGKTTAAIGTACRALSHGMRVAVIQFIKDERPIGERKILERIDNLTWLAMGRGCTVHRSATSDDVIAARGTWDKAREFLHDETVDLLILDEILYAIGLKFVSAAEVCDELTKRSFNQHVILTGRGAPAELIEVADQVTEMRSVKHPFDKGEKGYIGVDL